MENKENSSVLVLLPFAVFILIFLGAGIYWGDFYVFPAPIAALCGIISAFLLPKSNFKSKVEYFLKGCGDQNILTMCIIFLLAGAFATISKHIGSVEAVVNLGIGYFSPQYIPVGVFLIASFLSISAGTSVGTVVALAPIVFGISHSIGIDANIVGAALLCGAMFGDNLSFISDTTISATQSLGCEMKDKFKENIKIALPASLLSILIFIYLGNGVENVPVIQSQVKEFSIFLILPYLVVILLAVLGVNVFLVLLIGIVLSGSIGVWEGSLSWLDFSKKIYEGFLGMNDIFLLALFTGGLAGIVENLGGIDYLLDRVKRLISGEKSAYLGISLLVALADTAIANNTIAIVLTGKVAKKITDEQGLNAKYSASILDIFSCIVQGLIPYGAQVLILISLSGGQVDYLEMLKYTWYIYLLLVFALISIFFQRKRAK